MLIRQTMVDPRRAAPTGRQVMYRAVEDAEDAVWCLERLTRLGTIDLDRFCQRAVGAIEKASVAVSCSAAAACGPKRYRHTTCCRRESYRLYAISLHTSAGSWPPPQQPVSEIQITSIAVQKLGNGLLEACRSGGDRGCEAFKSQLAAAVRTEISSMQTRSSPGQTTCGCGFPAQWLSH